MKKLFFIIVVVMIAVGTIITFWGFSTYNEFVQAQENVKTSWSNVETEYQHRADLIPNAVEIVKGYAAHEKSTLEGVITARSKSTQMTINIDDLTSEKLQQFQKAQGEIGAALGRLLSVKEKYPELQANENFKKLQAKLDEIENKISNSRQGYNNLARNYNIAIRMFPKTIIAGICGFNQFPYFETDEENKKAPKIQF